MITIAGTDYAIQAPLSELDPYRVGQEFRVYDGTLASQTRAEKRRYTAVTSFLTETERLALKADVALDDAVTVALLVGGVTTTITARIRLTSELQQIGLWIVRLDIEEV